MLIELADDSALRPLVEAELVRRATNRGKVIDGAVLLEQIREQHQKAVAAAAK
jgi:hypothetical protein